MRSLFLKQIYQQLAWLLFAISLLVFSLGVSWQLNKASNFGYSLWYQVLDISSVLNRYVKHNSQGKQDFPTKDPNLHQQVFSEIVDAIHQDGSGLASISYVNQQAITRLLLTKSEVIHLQDVANLINQVTYLWLANLLLFILLLVGYLKKFGKQQQAVLIMPKVKHKVYSLLGFILVIIVALAVWGFTDIFYFLHTQVFPKDHQWFFYYEESLMSSLMKAPDLFAAIAVQLFICALILMIMVEYFITKYQAKH